MHTWQQPCETQNRTMAIFPLAADSAWGESTATPQVYWGQTDYSYDFEHEGVLTNKDPIRFDGGQINLYVYVGNDPINFIDMTGLRPLNVNETQIIREGLGDLYDLDTSSIDVVSNSLVGDVGNRAMVVGNTIYVDPSQLDSDGNFVDPALLVHEAVHVSQYHRQGWSYLPEALLEHLFLDNPYDYDNYWGIESEARYVEDNYEGSYNSKNKTCSIQ